MGLQTGPADASAPVRRDKKRVLDEYLVASAQAGDRKAFARLASQWQPALMRHAWRLTGDEDMARDALQDAWLDIVRGLPRLKDAIAFPAWSYRIVTRKCANTIRKVQSVRRTKQAVAAEPDQPPLDGEAQIEQRAELATISAAMATLPSDQRSALALYHMEDLSIAEISVALGVPAGTVKTRLMHARRKIRAALEKSNGGPADE
jgi:RNA polymerase sigma factor (sigma-70 family)